MKHPYLLGKLSACARLGGTALIDASQCDGLASVLISRSELLPTVMVLDLLLVLLNLAIKFVRQTVYCSIKVFVG